MSEPFSPYKKSFPKGWWVETTEEVTGDWRDDIADSHVWRVGLYFNGALILYRDCHSIHRAEPLVAMLQELVKGKEHG